METVWKPGRKRKGWGWGMRGEGRVKKLAQCKLIGSLEVRPNWFVPRSVDTALNRLYPRQQFRRNVICGARATPAVWGIGEGVFQVSVFKLISITCVVFDFHSGTRIYECTRAHTQTRTFSLLSLSSLSLSFSLLSLCPLCLSVLSLSPLFLCPLSPLSFSSGVVQARFRS